MYNLVFEGREVGEEGLVAMTYSPKEIWLQKGTKAVVEISGGSEEANNTTLHVPAGEGIVLATERSTTYGWSTARLYSGFAVWYPDLTDTPRCFSKPEGGKTTYDFKSYPSFLDPVRDFGSHTYYSVLVDYGSR